MSIDSWKAEFYPTAAIDTRRNCPLQQHTNYTCSEPGSQYERWVLENDPEPMIKALEEILAIKQS